MKTTRKGSGNNKERQWKQQGRAVETHGEALFTMADGVPSRTGTCKKVMAGSV